MDFHLTEEQRQIQAMVRDFAATEITPHMMAWDEAQTFPMEVVKQLGGLGMLGAIFPERYGGAGLSYIDYVNILEELGAAESGIALIVAAHNSLASGHIYLAGSEEQRMRWLPKLTGGEWLGCWALTEPGSGSDAGGLITTAVRDGDDWVLNGTKNFITNASHAQVAVVLAVSDKADRKRGVTAFAIEMDTPGIRAGKKENKLGMRTSDTAELILEDCRVPAANVLGEVGHGFIDAMKVLDGGRISIAALSLGIARGAYDAALAYAKERTAFGKPIGAFQAIQFMLTDMATEIEAARLLCYRAAAMKDAGLPCLKEAAMAKLFASEMAENVVSSAMQVFGGYGYVADFPIERIYRDVRVCQIYEGTSDIQKILIARAL